MSRKLMLLASLGLACLGLALWASGGIDALLHLARDQQRQVQDSLAGAVRALKAGQPGAWTALLSVCFGYGFFHAVGPGHGKAVIGAYGLTRRVPMVKLAGLALASSLAQAAVAVALVTVGSILFGWSRPQMEQVVDKAMLPLSYALVATLGGWLVWRGAQGLMRKAPASAYQHSDGYDDGHHHDHGPDCGCGHAHGPSLEQAQQVQSFRDAALLIAAIAMRPCSGALLLLVLTFVLGIAPAGIAGTFAMGFGTATVTIATAFAAVTFREGGLAGLTQSRLGHQLALTLPLLELFAGLVIAGLSLTLLLQSI